MFGHKGVCYIDVRRYTGTLVRTRNGKVSLVGISGQILKRPRSGYQLRFCVFTAAHNISFFHLH